MSDQLSTEKLHELLTICEAATPGPWSVWDSCSWRRIGTTMPYADGNVVCPVTQNDGHPDLLASREDLAHIATFDPTTCAALVREVLELRKHVADLNHDLDAAVKECNERHG